MANPYVNQTTGGRYLVRHKRWTFRHPTIIYAFSEAEAARRARQRWRGVKNVERYGREWT